MSMTLSEAHAALQVAPDAGRIEVERAYQQRKALYAEGALAIHALLEEPEGRAALERVEQAYQTIMRQFGERRPALVKPAVAGVILDSDAPGATLRRRREAQGISLTDMAHRTKISPMNLEYLEQERFDRLPAPVYLKGFLFQYLAALGEPDPEPLVARYLARGGEE